MTRPARTREGLTQIMREYYQQIVHPRERSTFPTPTICALPPDAKDVANWCVIAWTDVPTGADSRYWSDVVDVMLQVRGHFDLVP